MSADLEVPGQVDEGVEVADALHEGKASGHAAGLEGLHALQGLVGRWKHAPRDRHGLGWVGSRV